MNVEKLYEILRDTTIQLRKGDAVTGTPELVEEFKNLKPGETLRGGGVLEILDIPHVSETRTDLEHVDVHFLVVGVDKEKAEKHRAEFMDILNSYPDPEQLAGGPSYISVGATIGDQGAALQFFALGKALGVWSIITPAIFGMSGAEADAMAGSGFVMCTGYQTERAAA